MAENIDTMKSVARRFFEEVWPGGDVAGLAECLHPDGINHETPPGVSGDLEGAKQVMFWLRSAFSDQRYEIHHLIAEGDTVAVHLTHSGRHTGDFMGLPPTERPFAYRHVHILQFKDGKAFEHWAVRDDATLMRQLTSDVPAPELSATPS
jgi:predicted ester cyclase